MGNFRSLICGVALTFAPAASAAAFTCGSITQGSFTISCTIFVDTPDDFMMVVLAEGEFPDSSPFPYAFEYTGNWYGSLSGSFTNPSIGYDYVTASGEGHHIIAPHGEGEGPTFSFRTPKLYLNEPPYSKMAPLPHEAHVDDWRTTSFFSNGGGSTQSFRTSLVAFHTASVPEPATWAMMIIGFGAIGVARRRDIRAIATTA